MKLDNHLKISWCGFCSSDYGGDSHTKLMKKLLCWWDRHEKQLCLLWVPCPACASSTMRTLAQQDQDKPRSGKTLVLSAFPCWLQELQWGTKPRVCGSFWTAPPWELWGALQCCGLQRCSRESGLEHYCIPGSSPAPLSLPGWLCLVKNTPVK